VAVVNSKNITGLNYIHIEKGKDIRKPKRNEKMSIKHKYRHFYLLMEE